MEELSETVVGSDLPCSGPKATGSCSGIAVISDYCKGNSSAVEYSLGLKLIGLHIEDVSFTTDQTERHLEVGNTGYGNYDSSAKRHLLMSLEIFLRIYYKECMLGHLRACYMHLKRGLKYSFEFGNSSSGVGYRSLRWALGRGLRLPLEHCYA
ncbi:Uncharacterized protein Adt_38734 [Abeliophyllum distichum]|uniref:Uncharacterized protein n=1 Tax=Abeliophyllum distichum TaxID=126358 RepID=A0ABD1Q341_9LAMI